jgi:hypothetical protein
LVQARDFIRNWIQSTILLAFSIRDFTSLLDSFRSSCGATWDTQRMTAEPRCVSSPPNIAVVNINTNLKWASDIGGIIGLFFHPRLAYIRCSTKSSAYSRGCLSSADTACGTQSSFVKARLISANVWLCSEPSRTVSGTDQSVRSDTLLSAAREMARPKNSRSRTITRFNITNQLTLNTEEKNGCIYSGIRPITVGFRVIRSSAENDVQ